MSTVSKQERQPGYIKSKTPKRTRLCRGCDRRVTAWTRYYDLTLCAPCVNRREADV